MLNLAGIREAVRIRTGVPEKGTTGKNRMNKCINYALRHLWRDMPTVFMREEFRFLMEKAVSTGTIDVNPNDNRVFRLDTTASTWRISGTMNARWIDITDSDGVMHHRRILEVFRADTTPDWGAGGTRDVLVVDQPWINASDTGLTYRIYTYEYPYPADVQRVKGLIRDPEKNPREITQAAYPDELERWRLGYGWDTEGIPEKWARSDFFQLRAPHDTPTVQLETPAPGTAWGFSTIGGAEHGAGGSLPYYGVAGTFSYRYCLVWGRRPTMPANLGGRGVNISATSSLLRPFYISAPSKPSAQITTLWGNVAGGGPINVKSAHQEWMQAVSRDDTQMSWNRTGLEKWWFRARHGTETDTAANHAQIKRVEADGEYHLWRVESASVTSTLDVGDSDPVDIGFPLKEFTGHRHVRFDKTPTDNITQILMKVDRRPDTLKHDADMARIGPECIEALVELAASYLAGGRDGNVKRKSEYFKAYQLEVKELKRLYSLGAHPSTPMGDGLGTRPRWGLSDFPIKEQV